MKMEDADLTNKDASETLFAKDAEEENALIPMTSEQMEAEIDHQYFSKDGSFHSSGKSMLKELRNEFEERLLQIHKEQMEKWQEEVKELHVLDTVNEEADALVLNAKNRLQNVHENLKMFKTFSMSSRMGRDLQRYNEGCRQVVGCIPYRYKNSYQSGYNIDDLEFLLISSQKSPRLMFPKGGWEIDESLKDAALRETFEEAGVLGDVEVQDYLGTWSFKSKSQGTFHEGHMLPLYVTQELDEWPEKSARRRLWMKFNEAREVCWHPWMKEALDVFASKLAKRNKEEPQTLYPFKDLSIEAMPIIDTPEANQMYNTEEPRMDNAEANPLICEEPSINPIFVADSMFNETLFSEDLGISHIATATSLFNEDTRISIVAHS